MAKLAFILRWSGRLLGIYITYNMGLYALTQGLPYISTQTMAVQVGFIALFVALAGIITGWFSELIGGILLIVAYLIFSLSIGGFTIAPAFPFMLGIAILYITAYSLTRRLSTKNEEGMSRKERRHK